MAEDLSVEDALVELGLRPSVEHDEITRRYRRLARDRHPDHGGDAHAFQRLQRAYEVLRREHVSREPPAPPRTRGAPGWRAPRPVPVDLDDIDWSVEPPSGRPQRLTPDLLAAAVAAWSPERAFVARSRGPRTPLNLLTPVLSGDLTNELTVAGADGGLLVSMDVRRGRLRDRVMDAELPRRWTRVRENRTVRAERIVQADPNEPRMAAARTATVVEEMLAAVSWPLRAWWLDPLSGS